VSEDEDRQRRLLDAVVAVAGELDLPDTLRRIVQAAADLAGARYAALGVIGPHGQLTEFITVGVDDQERRRIGDPPVGHGILGFLIRNAEPVRIADLAAHPASVGFPANHPPMRSFLGVPLLVRGEVFGNLYLTQKQGAAEFTDADQEVVVALAAAAGIAVQNARLFEEARRRGEWLSAASRVTGTLLTGGDAAATRDLVVRTAADLAAADAALLLLREGDELVLEAVHGGPALVGGERAGRGYLPAGGLPVGVVDGWDDRLADGRALLEPADGGPSVLDGDTPVLLVPLRAQSRVIGVLAVVRLAGREPFARTDLQMVRAFAGQAALTVEFGRAADDRQRLAVLEDRSRIAEDLHDLVIQRIFAVGMGLQGMSARVDPPAAREQLSGFIDDLDATIRAIRQTIFSLQQAGPTTPGLRAEVLRVVEQAGPSLGFEPELVLEGPLDSVVPAATVPEVSAVLREALSNVARHAGAGRATVRVAVDTAAWTLTLTVQDDGAGPGPGDAPGLGTSTMQARARRLGGTCRLEPVTTPADGADGGPGRSGTRLRWQVSLDPAS